MPQTASKGQWEFTSLRVPDTLYKAEAAGLISKEVRNVGMAAVKGFA
jgi:hypothetical protein